MFAGPGFVHSIDFYLIECPPDLSQVDVTIEGETETLYLSGEVTFKEVALQGSIAKGIISGGNGTTKVW